MWRCDRPCLMSHVSCLHLYASSAGFTLIEIMLGASILVISLTAFLGVFFGQSYLAAMARNLTAAMNDASRVMEQIRLRNVNSQNTCGQTPPIPSAIPPSSTSWDAWLTSQRGKSVLGAGTTLGTNQFERLVVVCQQDDGSAYCGSSQVGSGEWKVAGSATQFDPIRVTVSVGWRQGLRVLGGSSAGQEFSYTNGMTQLAVNDVNNNKVIDSQAMLTAYVTCR